MVMFNVSDAITDLFIFARRGIPNATIQLRGSDGKLQRYRHIITNCTCVPLCLLSDYIFVYYCTLDLSDMTPVTRLNLQTRPLFCFPHAPTARLSLLGILSSWPFACKSSWSNSACCSHVFYVPKKGPEQEKRRRVRF